MGWGHGRLVLAHGHATHACMNHHSLLLPKERRKKHTANTPHPALPFPPEQKREEKRRNTQHNSIPGLAGAFPLAGVLEGAVEAADGPGGDLALLGADGGARRLVVAVLAAAAGEAVLDDVPAHLTWREGRKQRRSVVCGVCVRCWWWSFACCHGDDDGRRRCFTLHTAHALTNSQPDRATDRQTHQGGKAACVCVCVCACRLIMHALRCGFVPWACCRCARCGRSRPRRAPRGCRGTGRCAPRCRLWGTAIGWCVCV